MRILYIGDFIKGNGPSTVDMSLKNRFNNKGHSLYFFQSNDIKNFVNSLRKVHTYDVIHVSGVSFLGFLFLIFARIFRKKCTMTMHGSLNHEKNYRKVRFYRMVLESLQINLSHVIFPVSSLLAKNIDSLKTQAIPNGYTPITAEAKNKKKNLVTLIGGGRSEKRNLDVCRAVDEINKRYGLDILVNVFGELGIHTKLINDFEFVNNYGFCSKDRVYESLRESYLFIQYSEYEPFSLSVCDAINYKCRIITSGNVGINQFIKSNDFFKVVNNHDALLEAILNFSLGCDNREASYDHKLMTWDEVSNAYLDCWVNISK
ncbi:glycosyltransferase [Vibrio cyclitrophicus]